MMLPEKSQKSLLKKEDKKEDVAKYVAEVSKILEMHFAHSLRKPPLDMTTITKHWTVLLMKCGIPAESLGDLYMTALSNSKKGDYFSVETLISLWNESLPDRIRRKQQTTQCFTCKGKMTVDKFDFQLKKEVEVPCPACA